MRVMILLDFNWSMILLSYIARDSWNFSLICLTNFQQEGINISHQGSLQVICSRSRFVFCVLGVFLSW